MTSSTTFVSRDPFRQDMGVACINPGVSHVYSIAS